jgi:hypothetical protein
MVIEFNVAHAVLFLEKVENNYSKKQHAVLNFFSNMATRSFLYLLNSLRPGILLMALNLFLSLGVEFHEEGLDTRFSDFKKSYCNIVEVLEPSLHTSTQCLTLSYFAGKVRLTGADYSKCGYPSRKSEELVLCGLTSGRGIEDHRYETNKTREDASGHCLRSVSRSFFNQAYFVIVH